MTRRLLHLDAFSGVAGDMALAALLDVGADESAVRAGLAALGVEGWRLVVEPRTVCGIAARDVRVEVAGHQPHHRPWADLRELLLRAPLPDAARALAVRVFERLAEAEGRVHGVPAAEVRFHEVGALDSLVDVVGCALAIADLAPDRISCTPLPIGTGFVQTAHGPLPLPAPATAALLAGVPTRPSGLQVELVTPTGAALVAACVDTFCDWPSFVPGAVGYGAGDRTLPDRPNLLRVVLGEEHDAPAAEVVEVAANIDDMTPEAHGFLLEALLGAGALDAWFVPVQMKKCRPAVQVAALCEPASAERVVATFLRHSTTLGVRLRRWERRCLPREVRTVDTRFGSIRVKVVPAEDGAATRAAPEYEDCAAAARAAGATLAEVVRAALAALE